MAEAGTTSRMILAAAAVFVAFTSAYVGSIQARAASTPVTGWTQLSWGGLGGGISAAACQNVVGSVYGPLYKIQLFVVDTNPSFRTTVVDDSPAVKCRPGMDHSFHGRLLKLVEWGHAVDYHLRLGSTA